MEGLEVSLKVGKKINGTRKKIRIQEEIRSSIRIVVNE